MQADGAGGISKIPKKSLFCNTLFFNEKLVFGSDRADVVSALREYRRASTFIPPLVLRDKTKKRQPLPRAAMPAAGQSSRHSLVSPNCIFAVAESAAKLSPAGKIGWIVRRRGSLMTFSPADAAWIAA